MNLDLGTINVINVLFAGFFATFLAVSWWRFERNSSLALWALAASAMFAADVLFAVRAALGDVMGTIVPTLLITVSHLLLWAGILRFVGRQVRVAPLVLIGALHLAGQVALAALGLQVEARIILNSIAWTLISALAVRSLRHAISSPGWGAAWLPALALSLHALFHLARILFTVATLGRNSPAMLLRLGWVSSLEVTMFMVGLFLTLLMGEMLRRNFALQEALGQVQTLSGLLPICASCHQIRDDQGYWSRVETFISRRSSATFSHGLCPDCVAKLYPEFLTDEVPRV